MPFAIAYPFDPAEILPAWELTARNVDLMKGYDDEDDLDEDDDVTGEDEPNQKK